MQNRPPINVAECLATGVLWLFLLGFGWVNLLDGGISLSGKSGRVVYVSGGVGLGLAVGTFLFAGLVAVMFARVLALSRWATWLLVLAALVPPLFFVLFSLGH